MRPLLSYLAAAAAVPALFAAEAQATPVLYVETGHYYEVVAQSGNWNSANSAADARLLDVGGTTYTGHLATIQSQGENEFIRSLVGAHVAWVGGLRPGNGPTWTWDNDEGAFWNGAGLDGTPILGVYANWATDEPNNAGGYEPYVRMLTDGKWQDYNGTDVNFYVVEFNTATAAVPEPATLALLGLAGAGAAMRRRRRA